MMPQTREGQISRSRLDRRASPRRSGNPVPVSIVTEVLAEPFDGQVLDRSEGGLRLVVSRQTSVGMTLKVSPVNTGYNVWVEVQVVYCLSWADRWVLGCQFVNTPSADVMALLG